MIGEGNTTNFMVLNNHCTHEFFVPATVCLHQKALGKTPLRATVSHGCQCHHDVPAANYEMLYEQNISGLYNSFPSNTVIFSVCSNHFNCENSCQGRHKRPITMGDIGSVSAQHCGAAAPASWLDCMHPDVMLLCGSNKKAAGPQTSPIVPEPQNCCRPTARTNGLAALQASCCQSQQMGIHCGGPVLACCVKGLVLWQRNCGDELTWIYFLLA